MTNLPARPQQSLTPATSRSSPALEPTNETAGADGGPSLAGGAFVGASRWHPIRPAIRKTPAHRPHPVRDIVLPPDYTTAFRRAASRNHSALSLGVRFCVLKSI